MLFIGSFDVLNPCYECAQEIHVTYRDFWISAIHNPQFRKDTSRLPNPQLSDSNHVFGHVLDGLLGMGDPIQEAIDVFREN